MTNRKQSAVSRRQSNRLSGDTNLSLNSINNTLNNFIQSTSFNINSITNNLNQTTQVSSNTTLNLDYQLNVTNVGSLAYTANDHEIRILALEAAGPGGGGGGIDPTDPDVRVFFEDFLHLPDGNDTGRISPYVTDSFGTFTSGIVFNSGGFMSFRPAGNEAGHPGIIMLKFDEGDLNNPVYYSTYIGINETANVLRWDDVSRITFVLKHPSYTVADPETDGNYYNLVVGLSEDLDNPETNKGVYFNLAINDGYWEAVTRNTASTVGIGTTLSALGAWYRLDIKRNASNDALFYVNGTLMSTITTNIPTGVNLNLGISLETNHVPPSEYADTAEVLVDFVAIKLGDPEEGALLPEGVTITGTSNEVEVNYDSGTQVYTIGLPPSIIVDQATVDQLNIDTTLTPANPLGDGVIAYDPEYQSPVMGLDGGPTNTNINAPLGSALVKLVRNNTGSTITKGQVLYINGSHGSTHITVALADASSEATAKDTIGVAAHDIANNTEGWIITQGYLKGLNTNSTPGTGGEGSTLWLSTTAGAFTYDRPTAPDHGVVVGFMVKSAGSGVGSIYVKVSNGQELEELHDVYISGLANNDILQWDSTDLRWENRSLATAGIAAIGHTHSLTDITQSSANKYEVPQWNGTNWVAYDTRLPENRVIVASEMNAASDWTVYASGTGTSNIFTTAALTFDGRFGILTSSTGTTATGRAGISSAVLDQVVFGTYVTEFECIIRVPTLSDATNRFIVDAGFSDNQAGVAVDGIHFQYSDTVNSDKWICLRYNNNASANVDSGITVVAGTWYKLKIVVSTTEANFYINGTLVGTLNTIPTGTTRATGVFTGIRKTVGTTARTINIDYMHYTQETTR